MQRGFTALGSVGVAPGKAHGALAVPRIGWRTTVIDGGFNWSMQHTRCHCGGRSVADEAKTAHLLLG
jgi:hypothetical protein